MRTITYHQGAHSNALNRALAITTEDGTVYRIGGDLERADRFALGDFNASLVVSLRPTKGPSPARPDGISDEALIAVLEDRALQRARLAAVDETLSESERGNLSKVIEHLRHAREWLQTLTEEPLPKPPVSPKKNAASLSFKAAGIKPVELLEDDGTPLTGEALSEREAALLRATADAALLPAPVPVAPAIVFPSSQ